MFDWPREYLTSISGTCDSNLVDRNFSATSLTLGTNNKKTYEPFKPPNASEKGSFEFQLNDRVIVGFYGRETVGEHGKHLTGVLGVYTRHPKDLFATSNGEQVMEPRTKVCFYL